MATFTWLQRQTLIPSYELEKFTEKEVLEHFDDIKSIATKHYSLEGLSDAEIEDTLFKIYTFESTNFQNDETKDPIEIEEFQEFAEETQQQNKESFNSQLAKIIFLDYADTFLSQIAPQITEMLASIKPKTEFKDNQNLYSTKHQLVRLNRQTVEDCFNVYFCSFDGKIFTNKMTSTNSKIEDDFLAEMFEKKDNLFIGKMPRHPEFSGKYYLSDDNHDPKYWKGYIRYIEAQRKDLLEHFKAKGKEEELDDFRAIANIYYLYAVYYKMSNQVKVQSKKTL